MDLIAVARIAVRALARNKMRSILTMLGIIIGVGAVIAMVGVGQGAQQQVQQQIAAMGSNILFVWLGYDYYAEEPIWAGVPPRLWYMQTCLPFFGSVRRYRRLRPAAIPVPKLCMETTIGPRKSTAPNRNISTSGTGPFRRARVHPG